ncbi:MAG TPA: hypothetical protein VIL77_05160 [Gaiellaceae bacterium]
MTSVARVAGAARAAAARRRASLEYLRYALRPGMVRRNGGLFVQDRVGRRRYRLLSEDQLRATRRSETAFVFGSGRSLLEITPGEWEEIARHDTVSFREFPRQQWVRADYHVTGEVDFLDEYARRLNDNPLYRDTVFVVQEGWLAESGNGLVGRRLLPEQARVFRYHRVARGRYAPPSRRFRDGVVHGFNSSISTTNFAILMGWRRIVLTGIDLYDKGYFWLGESETRAYEKEGVDASMLFTNAERTVSTLGRWRELLQPEGIELLVWNPRSLLAEVLPVLDRGTL